MELLAIERRNQIANRVLQTGNVTIAELTEQYKVSAETIRKDLLFLEQQQLLIRTHGGAVRFHTGSTLAPLSVRKKEHIQQKQELCRYALSFVENGDSLFIDEGSTAVELARLLVAHFDRLTIVTHSLEIFHILSQNSGFRLMLCGGFYHPEESAFHGHLTVDAIRQLQVDKAFVFPSGISLKTGITDYGEEFVSIQRACIDQANRVFILANSEKFQKNALYKVWDMDPAFTYITDSGLTAALRSQLKAAHFSIIHSSGQTADT